jgi:DNA mismatch repair protein MutS2
MEMRTLKALEFDKILSMLSGRCTTSAARERALTITPISNLSILENTLRETRDAADIIEKMGTPPLAVTDGIEGMLSTARLDGLLSPGELGFVERFAVTCRRMADYMKKAENFQIELSLNGRAFMELDDLELEISAAIRGDSVADNASPDLMNARRRIERCTMQLRERLSTLLRSHPEYYADGYVAERGGRQTLPVKSQHVRNVPGTIIDRSQTGATVFVEPNVATKLRTELDQALVDEENEVRRVLYALTALVDDMSDAILQNARLMERLDLAFARGALGLEMGGVIPEFREDRAIEIKNGRHPLLDREKAVPLNLAIQPPTTGLVITGPNTGGKTVALKTVGLFSLMAQSGLMVPAESAALCPFDHVLADVGDGQSISENLSTFSAHITAVMGILGVMTPNSLVLMDELGSGTDPAEGMGLAVAVLEQLIKSSCLFFVTTHYPEIKEFARTSDAIINARMKFDPASLRPLYTLEMGEAGESCALLIAQRLGMPMDVIKRARRAVNGEIACEVRPREGSRARFERYDAPKAVSERAAKFGRGDSVRIYPAGETGIVVEGADDMGRILVQTRTGKRLIPHKRLKLVVKAEMLYPEDYDFSIVFDSVANRKARHRMDKRHDSSLVITEDPIVKN